MNALSGLLHEHRIFDLLLCTYKKHLEEARSKGRLRVDISKPIIQVIKDFAVGSHMVKEERHLVPKLFTMGVPRNFGPILLLGEEHGRIHDDLARLYDIFDDLCDGNKDVLPEYMAMLPPLINFLRLHMLKEENSIFVIAETVFGEKEWEELEEAFDHADRAYGVEKAHAFEQKIYALAAEYDLTLQDGKVVPKSSLHLDRSGAFVLKNFKAILRAPPAV